MSCAGRLAGIAIGMLLGPALLAPAWGKPPLNPWPELPDPPGAGLLAHPDPGQFPGRPPPPPLPGVGNFERLPAIDETTPVVLAVRKTPYWKAGTYDPVLSNACALGYFETAAFNRLVVQFTAPGGGAALQVVPPAYRHLLYDARHLARPDETYFFKNSNEANCAVWIEGKVPPRSLQPGRGTFLPKQKPGDLAREKTMIGAWPKK
ncbi:hypothetical protein GALL_87420 [mine drainage metagenome]|uniref:Uncharacterized protein n=1 Tax=mine drainage metagenome TaxID=410659 RepID=A0A1J5SL14_9ZZZZ